MKLNEIGSEFSSFVIQTGTGIKRDNSLIFESFVFSGRTAIETILKNEPFIHKALLPSYCCDSMIEPFRTAGIKVEFYPVYFDGGLKISLNISKDIDCIFWCNYFGFTVSMPNLSAFINCGGIVIEDITHSFYSKEQSHEQSTFLVASLRKWEPVLCGGYCASRKGVLNYIPENEPSKSFLILKKKAMDMKRNYLSGDTNVDKSEFLRMFSDSNWWLANNYSELSIDTYSKEYLKSVDYEFHRDQRIKNARVLYEGLKDSSDIKFLFPLSYMDCPLFVPIVIPDGKRDLIRKKLIDQSIYCPIHWPHPNAECESNLYGLELSLICDQRYGKEDMQRIISVLNEDGGY